MFGNGFFPVMAEMTRVFLQIGRIGKDDIEFFPAAKKPQILLQKADFILQPVEFDVFLS